LKKNEGNSENGKRRKDKNINNEIIKIKPDDLYCIDNLNVVIQ